MFYTVHLLLHTTKQKLEGNVREICVKSLPFSNLHCSVFQHISVGEMFYTVQWQMHDRNQKLQSADRQGNNNKCIYFFILQHVRNSLNGEAKVITLAQSYNVDGYHAASNTVYEYQGCIFHGCCKCYPKQRNIKRFCHSDRTVSEVYEATLKKTAILRDAGYTVFEMWGCDFARQKETDPELAKFLENFEFVPPLEPRDAFFGGRTGTATLYAKMAED